LTRSVFYAPNGSFIKLSYYEVMPGTKKNLLTAGEIKKARTTLCQLHLLFVLRYTFILL
jgi:hypothetical protein